MIKINPDTPEEHSNITRYYYYYIKYYKILQNIILKLLSITKIPVSFKRVLIQNMLIKLVNKKC